MFKTLTFRDIENNPKAPPILQDDEESIVNKYSLNLESKPLKPKRKKKKKIHRKKVHKEYGNQRIDLHRL